MPRKKRNIVAAGLLITVVVCLGASGQTTTRSQDAPRNLKVDVELVTVNATVTDNQNRVITGLDKEHFKIWEDKLEQSIETFSAEDVPVSLGVVFDISGSMKEKIGTARDAAVTFLKTGNPEDEYFLATFSNRPEMAEDFTTDISKLQNKLLFEATKGMTAMYDAVYLSLEKLKEGTNPKKALLLITDGEDNRSRYSFSNVREFVKEQNVQIYAIGITSGGYSQLSEGRSGRTMIEELADTTGGHAFFPDSVYDLEDICTKIAVELKNQYVIGYKSSNETKDGKWRKIRVKVEGPKGVGTLNVRNKTGYYAPEPGPMK